MLCFRCVSHSSILRVKPVQIVRFGLFWREGGGGGSTVCKHVFLKGLSTRLTDSSGNEGNHSMGVLSSS